MNPFTLACCLCLVLPNLGWAKAPVFGQDRPTPPPTSHNAQITFPIVFEYIAPVAHNQAVNRAIERPPAQQKVADLAAAGHYQTAGDEGLRLMANNENIDDQLQLIIANSLAWTGRVREAVPAYQGITKGTYANDANVGLANIHRWRGRDDLALPLYQQVLANDPQNAGALEGLALANQALAGRTTVGIGGLGDSSELTRHSQTINHRWRNASGDQIFELELHGFTDQLPTSGVDRRDMTFRYQDLGMNLKPSIELSLPTSNDPRLYATGRIRLLNDQVTVGAGRIDWGQATINPNVSIAGLWANYVGIEATETTSLGTVTAHLDHYGISDGNTIRASGLHFSSAWRPFGKHFKPFVGLETRTARHENPTYFNAPTYWAPIPGYAVVYTGLFGEWAQPDWTLFASAQIGAPINGDPGNNWSFSAGGKRWLSDDVALNVNLWSMASWRDDTTYRSQSFNLNLEKLWR